MTETESDMEALKSCSKDDDNNSNQNHLVKFSVSLIVEKNLFACKILNFRFLLNTILNKNVEKEPLR